MKVLVACEESQEVCKAFRARGHEAYSCDIQPCSGGHPEWHILDDVLKHLEGWGLIIAHPPCTYLTVSGNRHFDVSRYGQKAIDRLNDRVEAAEFFMQIVNAPCDHIAIENPVGYMNTHYRKPDQIIQPYYFGHPVSKKKTCLWLKNLPKLVPTDIVEPECIHSKGKSGGYSGPSWLVRDENGKIISYGDPRVARARSKTYSGIASAMAEQWGDILEYPCFIT